MYCKIPPDGHTNGILKDDHACECSTFAVNSLYYGMMDAETTEFV